LANHYILLNEGYILMIIHSDSLSVEQELKELVRLCERSGSHFHPDLIIQCQDKELGLASEKPHDKVLAALSPSSLLPVKRENFTLERNHLVLSEKADTGWSVLQSDIAAIIFSIYKQTDKVDQYKKNAYWLSLVNDPELRIHIANARPFGSKDSRFLDHSKSPEIQKQVIIDNFLQSRILAGQEPGKINRPVIVPIVEYINHHWNGSPFQNHADGNDGGITVWCSMPAQDSKECFGYYSAMDGLDSYIKYGFVDYAAPFVRSIPVDIELDSVGKIEILGAMAKSAPGKIFQGLKTIPRQIPGLTVLREGELVRISHIFFPGQRTPNAMRAILRILIQQLIQGNENELALKQLVRKSEEIIIKANIEFYEKLKKLSNTSMLEALAVTQLNKIWRYAKARDKS
jgi:hypothetical protein